MSCDVPLDSSTRTEVPLVTHGDGPRDGSLSARRQRGAVTPSLLERRCFVPLLDTETVPGIVCPFQWVWENANTPPKGNSTIEHAILVVGERER